MKKYLVVYEVDDEELTPIIETDCAIFNKMDMGDCYPIRILHLYYLKEKPFELIPCDFYGAWHDFKDPLKMEIVGSETEEVYSVGHGTDH